MNETARDVFLVYTTTEEGHGGVYLWWGPKRSGYTRLIAEAGRYTRDEAAEIVRTRGEEGALPLSVVEAGAVLKISGKLKVGIHEEGATAHDGKQGQRHLALADAVIDELKGRSGMWPDNLDDETEKDVRETLARIVGGTS